MHPSHPPNAPTPPHPQHRNGLRQTSIRMQVPFSITAVLLSFLVIVSAQQRLSLRVRTLAAVEEDKQSAYGQLSSGDPTGGNGRSDGEGDWTGKNQGKGSINVGLGMVEIIFDPFSFPSFFLPFLFPSNPLCFSPTNSTRQAGRDRKEREAEHQRNAKQRWPTNLAWRLEWMGVDQRYDYES